AVFDRIGVFDEELVRNQDDELNARLLKQGGRIMLIPEVVSHYYARGSLGQVARMFYQYGYFKPLAAWKVGQIMTLRQVVPALFVGSFGYHEVTDHPGTAGFQRPGALPYKHTGEAFTRNLDAIAAASCPPERVTDLDLTRPGRHVLLTFDDGGKSAVPIGDALA